LCPSSHFKLRGCLIILLLSLIPDIHLF
jgi:hypothetical protein